MNTTGKQHRAVLQKIARRVMLEKGLLPDFSAEALAELDRIQDSSTTNGGHLRDFRDLLWASIDNDDTRDIDQLTVAETMPGGEVKILVAVADVDSIIKSGSAIDDHARHNATSVYTAAAIFPMLPEKLSTNLTSLNFNEDRFAIVFEMVAGADGSLRASDIYRARVCNRAKLAYSSAGAWLEGTGIMPEAVAAVNGLDENLRVQDAAAQRMKNLRHSRGALSFETIEARPVFEGDEIRDLVVDKKNRAKDIIENFMIAANSVAARYLSSNKLPSLHRVVRTPKRWDRIVEIASEHGFRLPYEPDSKMLEEFLMRQKEADPLRFPDLSLSIIKLLGPGEYVAELPGEADTSGHFGLAVRGYAHSTAPNRRYTDLVTQRLLKAAMEVKTPPYSNSELEALARHCTDGEDAANKVERQVGKSVAALLFQSKIGERFEAIVTGAAPKGTWVRILQPPIEGKLVQGFEGMDVGHRIRVQIVHTDVEKGFIDFKKID